MTNPSDLREDLIKLFNKANPSLSDFNGILADSVLKDIDRRLPEKKIGTLEVLPEVIKRHDAKRGKAYCDGYNQALDETRQALGLKEDV